MVYRSTEPVDRAAACFPRDQRCSIQSSSTGSTSFAPQALLYSMQIVRRHFLNSSVPPQITDVIMSSWRQGTQKQYNVYINKWSDFCTQRQVNSLSPTVTDILHFLHALYQQNLSYSTLNTARSALSTLFLSSSTDNPHPITTLPFITRYMKGIFNSRKPTPKYSETWNVSLVLGHLKHLYPLADMSLKAHSHKLVMLLALTSGQRCQTLAALDIANIKKTEQYYLFGLEEHTKQNRPGNMFSNFCVRRYDHDNLCPYQALETYLPEVRHCDLVELKIKRDLPGS